MGNILATSYETEYIMDNIVSLFRINIDKLAVPEIYLDAKLKQKQLNGYTCC